MSLDIVAKTRQHCCQKNGNDVEATFDFVEATFDGVERIVRLGTFENVVATLLLVWAGLKMFPGSR